ncbi:MAG: hypothetical protein EBR82_73625 [Caulobacteraceae bacterium]|jgi:hypothetical protein|nr:hypothetical protein [Caulobacteraceae bacterium]
MEMMIWNVVLTAFVGVMAFMLKGKFDELDRLGILLNKTREEVARDHVTRSEVRSDMERLMERLDAGIQRLENKIDELAKSGRNAQR